MLVICYGMAESVSTQAFEAMKAVLARGGSYIAELSREKLTDLSASW